MYIYIWKILVSLLENRTTHKHRLKCNQAYALAFFNCVTTFFCTQIRRF